VENNRENQGREDMSHIVIDARLLRESSGRYVERLLHYLQQIDTENRYTVLLKPKDIDGWVPTNPNFTKLAAPYKEFTFGEQLGLLRLVYKLRPDLVHFAFTQQPILYPNKVVTTMHDLTTLRFDNPDKNPVVFKIKQKVYLAVNYLAAQKSLQVITPTEFVKKDVMKTLRVPDSRVTYTYESADKITDAAEPVMGVKGKKYIMYLGRPTPHKNLWRLVEAFKEIQKTHPDMYLVLAGKYDNNYALIAQKIKNEQIANIIFTDFISDGQLSWLYEHTSAYIFPSLSEGFGLPGLEAMHFGAPVVSSNATCLPEVYKDAAYYFDPLNTQDMAAKIAEVLDNKALADKLSKAGLQLVKQYSWKRMAEQTLEIYNNALDA
jgi:glycosyltransferase involved in cell wall biosynthesis